MKPTQMRTLLFILVLMCHLPLFAQKDYFRHEFSLHSGYGNMLKGTPGLTLTTHNYEHKLTQGVNWDAQYHFRPLKHFVIGAVYSGFSSQGSHAEGSDHLWVHFFGAQIGVCNVSTNRWQMRITGGPGGIFFRNNSTVFDKTRTATATSLGLLLNGSTAYKITPHWGIGMEIQYLIAGLASMQSRYHYESTTVTFNDEHIGNLSRLNINMGLSYYF